MITVQELKNMPIPEIMKVLKKEEAYTVDLIEMSKLLKVSIQPYNFEEEKIDGEKIICAFITNEKVNKSCIFYSDDLYYDQNNIGRMAIAWTFAKYIVTGNNIFYITKKTVFSDREKMLGYELLMPQAKVLEALDLLILPTTLSLSETFAVSQEFVRQRLDRMQVNRYIAGYDY